MSINLLRRDDDPARVLSGPASPGDGARVAPAPTPHADTGGRRWVLAVLEDLRLFADGAGMSCTARALAHARDVADEEVTHPNL